MHTFQGNTQISAFSDAGTFLLCTALWLLQLVQGISFCLIGSCFTGPHHGQHRGQERWWSRCSSAVNAC